MDAREGTQIAVIVGGSIAGLASAIALSEIGYRVVILERSAAPPTGPIADVANTWRRPTVPQATQSHVMTSLGIRVLRQRAPHVLAAALDAGGELVDLLDAFPPAATRREREPGDEELVVLGCRRTTFELVLYRAAAALPLVTIQHDTKVSSLELAADRRHIRGVVTDRGERIAAAVVIDATGRRACSAAWLQAAGLTPPPDLTSDTSVVAYARFYRLADHTPGMRPSPMNRGTAVGDLFDHYLGVLHLGDAGTFSIGLGALPGDRSLAALREPAGFTAAARATPGLGPWLDRATPISDVHGLTWPPNALRGTAVGREPVVAGLFPVGDAACVTNPMYGRGISLALAHAFGLADVLRDAPDLDTAQVRSTRMVEELCLPWYRHAVATDADRIERWTAVRNGEAPRPRPVLPIVAAAATNGAVWRGLMRVQMCLRTPAETFEDESFQTQVREAPPIEPPQLHGPSRSELVHAMATAMEHPP